MKKIICLLRQILGIESLEKKLLHDIQRNYSIETEILSALKFNSTIIGSEWFVFQNISPGGSAIDYSFFYTLYRVLTAIKPNSILEFGLGQSSKMVHQYASFYSKEAVTVEHDPTWVNFFIQSKGGDYTVKTQLLELTEELYKEKTVLTYKNCYQTFKNEKFDLIIVDGPFGFGEDTVYSRPQIIELSKHCLKENFIIIIDDYDRQGEKNTVNEVLKNFKTAGIDVVTREYGSIKKHFLITVPNNKFLTTL